MRLLSLLGLLLTLCVTSLSLVSCRGGGDPDVPIVISGITPVGIVGTPGDSIQFSANVTGVTGSPVYAWNFGGGATPNTSSSETPTVVLGSVDTYSASLTVSDGVNLTALPFSFEVVDVPVVQSVTPTGSAGLPLGVVQFTAEILGSPTSFEWRFDDGAVPSISTDEEPEVLLQDAGTYAGELVATNANGDSEEFPFSYTVDAPVAPSWTFVKVGMERADGPRGLCAKVVDGHLVLAYNMTLNDSGVFRNAIRYTRATVEMPTTELEFQSHTVMLESDSEHPRLSGWQGLAFSDEDLPYLLFGTTPSEPGLSKLARAADSTPSATSDWTVTEVEYDGGTTNDGQILHVLDSSLLAIIKSSSGLYIFESSDLAPEDQADWTYHLAAHAEGLPLTLPFMQLSTEGRLQIIASRPVGHAFSPIIFCQSTTDHPTADNDWSRFAVDIRDAGWDQDNYLALFDEKPVVYAPGSPGTSWAALLYFTAETHPSNLEDFTAVQISPEGTRVSALGLETASGRLAALYRDMDREVLGIFRQTGTDPGVSTNWSNIEVTPPVQSVTSPATLLTIAGRLAIVFVDPRDNRLTLAIADGEF